MFSVLLAFPIAFSQIEYNKFLLINRKQLLLFLSFFPNFLPNSILCWNIIHFTSFLEEDTSCKLEAYRLDVDNK